MAPVSAPIHFLLPIKERFTASNAGAVAQVVQDMATASQFRDNLLIIGGDPKGPVLADLPYLALAPKLSFIHGRNLGLAAAYLHWLDRQPVQPRLIEVHGRAQVAAFLAKRRPDLKIALFLHNDPRQMRGSKTAAERGWLLENLAGIFANSDYIRGCFLDRLNASALLAGKVHLTPLGVDPPQKKYQKQKKIILVSRMVPEKGVLEAARACARILPDFPDWRLQLIGARGFANSAPSIYEKQVLAALSSLADQAEMTGFLPRQDVQRAQLEAAVMIVPSQWQEPASRAILEAMACGCALITSRRGGIAERASGRAILLDDPSDSAIAEALASLLKDPANLKKWQDRAGRDYGFTIAAMAKTADRARLNAAG